MALPSSGTISMNDVFIEFAMGGCIDTTSNPNMGLLALAQNPNYVWGTTVSMSQFYNSSCPKSTIGGGK